MRPRRRLLLLGTDAPELIWLRKVAHRGANFAQPFGELRRDQSPGIKALSSAYQGCTASGECWRRVLGKWQQSNVIKNHTQGTTLGDSLPTEEYLRFTTHWPTKQETDLMAIHVEGMCLTTHNMFNRPKRLKPFFASPKVSIQGSLSLSSSKDSKSDSGFGSVSAFMPSPGISHGGISPSAVASLQRLSLISHSSNSKPCLLLPFYGQHANHPQCRPPVQRKVGCCRMQPFRLKQDQLGHGSKPGFANLQRPHHTGLLVQSNQPPLSHGSVGSPRGGCVWQPHTPFSHLLPNKLTLHPSIAEKQVLYQRRIDGRSSSCASNAPCNLFPHRLRDTLPNRQQQYCLGPRSPESHHRMFLLQDVENRPAGLGLVANQM